MIKIQEVLTEGGGPGRSSGAWNANPQGRGITGSFDRNCAEMAPSF